MFARLDKTEHAVLCGALDCGFTLGRVLRHEGWTRVWLGQGWTPRRDDGVWVLSRRAAERLRQPRADGSRRLPLVKRGAHPREGRVLLWLPQEIGCLGCGSRQVLDGVRLKVPPTAVRSVCGWTGCTDLRADRTGFCPRHRADGIREPWYERPTPFTAYLLTDEEYERGYATQFF